MALACLLLVGWLPSRASHATEETFPAAPPLPTPAAPDEDPLDPEVRLRALDAWAKGSFLDPDVKARARAKSRPAAIAQNQRAAPPRPVPVAPPPVLWNYQPQSILTQPVYCAPGGG